MFMSELVCTGFPGTGHVAFDAAGCKARGSLYGHTRPPAINAGDSTSSRFVLPDERDTVGSRLQSLPVTLLRSIALFVVAALFEIGGAWLVWQGIREQRGWLWAAGGVLALGAYGFVATLQPDPHFGRILAAYGGVFVAGSLAWGVVLDGYRPDRYDIVGALICLVGVAVIMYAPRGH